MLVNGASAWLDAKVGSPESARNSVKTKKMRVIFKLFS
jgi:hypothetical protein